MPKTNAEITDTLEGIEAGEVQYTTYGIARKAEGEVGPWIGEGHHNDFALALEQARRWKAAGFRVKFTVSHDYEI